MTAGVLRLYEVADALVAIGEQLIENGGELTPEIEAELAVLDGAFEQKVERILLYGKNLEASAEAAAAEARRLNSLSSTRANAARRLRDYVKAQMETAGRPKVETDRIVARIQKNSRPSITCAVPLDQLPASLVRVTTAFSADAAYEQFKTGVPLPAGIEVLHGTHLRVQ